MSDTFRCGCERTDQNTYSSAGRKRCRRCYNRYMRDYRLRAAEALREKRAREAVVS